MQCHLTYRELTHCSTNFSCKVNILKYQLIFIHVYDYTMALEEKKGMGTLLENSNDYILIEKNAFKV